MTRQALLDLAAKCEAATGANREIDQAIHELVVMRLPEMTDRTYPFAKNYTSSLDAAMTLVPDGWSRYFVDDGYGCHACVWDVANRSKSGGCKDAATPALALTDACLRALAQEIEHDGHS